MARPMSAPVPAKTVIDSKDLKHLYITVFPKSLTEDFYQFGACCDLFATSIFIISQYKTNRTAYLQRKKQCPKMMKESRFVKDAAKISVFDKCLSAVPVYVNMQGEHP